MISIYNRNKKTKQKCVAYPQEVLKLIIRLFDASKGAIRRNLQTRPKIVKNLLKHQINQSER
jgi:hypothetical protein